MPIEKFLRYFPDYQVTETQLVYARYLEQQGKTFLVHFGFDNAEDITWSHLATIQ
jgi:hypothetical protein